MERVAGRLVDGPVELELLQKLGTATGLLQYLPFNVNLRRVQNVCYKILQTVYPGLREKAEKGDSKAREWVNHFRKVAARLSVRIK